MSHTLHLIEETSFRRPGVRSILGAYFTFRLVDTVRVPKIANSKEVYPLHRTSVWSQLYGRTHFLYFDDWSTGIWQSADPLMMNVGRVALILALLPTALFLCGAFRELKGWVKARLWLEASITSLLLVYVIPVVDLIFKGFGQL